MYIYIYTYAHTAEALLICMQVIYIIYRYIQNKHEIMEVRSYVYYCVLEQSVVTDN